MKLEQLQAKLLASARQIPPNDHVPLGFEKRVMAHIRKPIADAWLLWGRALWRSAVACMLGVALFGGWALQMEPSEGTDLSQDFEETVLAGIDEQPHFALEETW